MVNEEELESLLAYWDGQNKNLAAEKIKLMKKLRALEKELREASSQVEMLSREIALRRQLEEANSLILEETRHIEGMELLREQELRIITDKMNKVDYRNKGSSVRYIDLERICREVIDMKKQYPLWTLIDIQKCGQRDTDPPFSFYSYDYQDEKQHVFQIRSSSRNK